MRILLALALITAACSSKSTAVNSSPLAQCPNNVAATVRNSLNRSFDVYYTDGRARTMLGEVAAGSSNTFRLPGVGRGYVSVSLPQADGGDGVRTNGNGSGVQIRVHCVGT